MIVVGILAGILAFTIVAFATSLLIERAYAGRLRPFVTFLSAAAVGSIAFWLLQGGAAESMRSLTGGLTLKSGAVVVLAGVTAGILISGL